MGLPLKIGDEVIGIIGLANCADGYNQAIIEFLQPIIIASTQIVKSYKNQREKFEVETVLKTSELRNRMIIEAAQVAVWDWDIKTDHTIWNDRLERLFGHTSGIVANSKQWWLDLIHPEDYASVADSLSTYLQSGIGKWQMEYRFRRADEQWATVMDWGVALKDKTGTPVRMIGALMDITARQKREDSLRLYEEILHNMEEGVMLTRASDTAIVFTNPKFDKMFGYDPGELIDRPMKIVNAPTAKSPEEVASAIFNILNQKGMWHGTILNMRKDGTSFWCRATISGFEHHEYGQVKY